MNKYKVNVPILGYTKNLTTAAEDLAALGIESRDQSFAKGKDLRDVGRVLGEGKDPNVTFDRNPPKKEEVELPWQFRTCVQKQPKLSSLAEDFKNMGLSVQEQTQLKKERFEPGERSN